MGVLDIIVRLLDQFKIIALPVGMLLGYRLTAGPSDAQVMTGFESVTRT